MAARFDDEGNLIQLHRFTEEGGRVVALDGGEVDVIMHNSPWGLAALERLRHSLTASTQTSETKPVTATLTLRKQEKSGQKNNTLNYLLLSAFVGTSIAVCGPLLSIFNSIADSSKDPKTPFPTALSSNPSQGRSVVCSNEAGWNNSMLNQGTIVQQPGSNVVCVISP